MFFILWIFDILSSPYDEKGPELVLLRDGLISNRTETSKNYSNIYSFSKTEMTERTNMDYISSNVQIKNCTFTLSYSYGPYYIIGSGGALFMIDSNLHILNSTFVKCWSLIGGAISVLSSNVLIEKNCKFNNCLSYYEAGAVFHSSLIKTFSHIETIIKETIFHSCHSREIAGAVYLKHIDYILFESCSFINNQAGSTAGAIGIFNNNAKVQKCSFFNNSCGNHTNINKFKYFTGFRKTKIPKGGGAILIVGNSKDVLDEEDVEKETKVPQFNSTDRYFITQQCCFSYK